ncbi:MAG: hypothetical protein J6U54_08250 [Clostridiales bacterium]|nr:hypothetical protein [Clostridiales bacterium]
MNKRTIAAILMILTFTFCITNCADLFEKDPKIESVNIHYSGGYTGHYDADLTVYQSSSKYYLKYRTTNQGTTEEMNEEYEITKKEYIKATEMLDCDKLLKMKGAVGCDMIYYTVKIKEKNKGETDIPSKAFSFSSPYSKIERLYRIKNGTYESTEFDEFNDKVWNCFHSNKGENGAIMYKLSGEYADNALGQGFGVYYSDLSYDFSDINEELLTEIEMMYFYDNGTLSSYDLDASAKERRELISKATDQRAFDGENHFYDTNYTFFFNYPKALFNRGRVSEDSLDEILTYKFEKEMINGKETYTRTVRADDLFAVIILIPEDNSYVVYLSDSYSKSYEKEIKALIINEL